MLCSVPAADSGRDHSYLADVYMCKGSLHQLLCSSERLVHLSAEMFNMHPVGHGPVWQGLQQAEACKAGIA